MTILSGRESLKMIRNKSKTKTVSDKIHELLQAEESKDPENESDEEGTGAKFTEFDEAEDGDLRLSDIRKKNIKYLTDVDKKYQGKIASRKDFFDNEDEDSDGFDESEDDIKDKRDIDFASDSDEDDEDTQNDDAESDDEAPGTSGAFVRINRNFTESGDEIASDMEDENDEDDDDAEDDEDEDEELSNGGDDDVAWEEEGEANGFNSTNNSLLLIESNLVLKENLDENIKKGICVQNQLKMWEKLLEIRIKSQKCLISANCLPVNNTFKMLYENEEFKEAANNTINNVQNVLSNLLELQETLLTKYPETSNLLAPGSKRKSSKNGTSNGKRIKIEEFSGKIQSNYDCFKDYRNSVIQKWHDRTKVSGNMKNIMNSQNILTKIENSMINKDEMVRKTQIYRGGYNLFVNIEKNAGETGEPEEVCSPEIFDDSDFYHQLLRELIEFKTNSSENPSEITSKLVELQRIRKRMKKNVDTKASKGRKIRYVVHNKMVNYTAPRIENSWTDDAKTELFSSLFGGVDQS